MTLARNLLLATAAIATAPTQLPAQTTAQTTAKSTAKPAVHHTTPATHHATAPPACPSLPTLSATIPREPGCPKPLYALQYIDTVVGTGAPAVTRKWLTVNYTGYLLDGTKFDSSIGTMPDGKPKEPITFPYGAHQVITGWDTGFEGMNVGGKRRLFIPYELAYGESGRPPVIPAKSPLVFDLELIAISDTPPAPKTPPAPPAGQSTPPAGQSTPPTGTNAPPRQAPSNAIPPTTAPPASTPPADPTKPTSIPPTIATPATSPKPTPPPVI